MRLSRIWRISQVEKGVIRRAQMPMCIKDSEICRILHILQKLNSLIAFSSFRSLINNTTSSPNFLGQCFNNLQWAALLMSFWRHRLNMQIWSTAAGYVNNASGFDQSETGINFGRVIKHYWFPVKRSQHATAIFRKIVGRKMLRAFDHRIGCVATCWVLLAQVWKWSNLSQQHPSCRNMSQQGGQKHAKCCT